MVELQTSTDTHEGDAFPSALIDGRKKQEHPKDEGDGDVNDGSMPNGTRRTLEQQMEAGYNVMVSKYCQRIVAFTLKRSSVDQPTNGFKSS
eukprot:CAMPEP_0113921212 /NCGR_PEP_ID=MMETSP1159-20121227/964_1 /TAXON_ID=88271 /ORGANISM="Picocystis salinarum" /LENGTH=90 /DNA_ID=CAMNT_0000921249 /DNA_START=195 /DNA_END=468 /DNA_ORIENTATION=+ /assembly_acc=CAM_ASM_000767